MNVLKSILGLAVCIFLVGCGQKTSSGSTPMPPALGHPRPEVQNNPEAKKADEAAHHYTPPNVPVYSATHEIHETAPVSSLDPLPVQPIAPPQNPIHIATEDTLFGYPLSKINGISCLDAPFDLSTEEGMNAFDKATPYQLKLKSEECLTKFEICAPVNGSYTDTEGQSHFLHYGQVPVTCTTLSKLKPEDLTCQAQINFGVQLKRFLNQDACEQYHLSSCVKDSKGQESIHLDKTIVYRNCWRKNVDLGDQSGKLCRDYYDESVDKVLKAYQDLDECLRSSQYGCDLQQNNPEMMDEAAPVCFQSVEPVVKPDADYVHPRKMGLQDIRTGVTADAISWKVDLLSCKDGSVQLSPRDSKCAPVAINPGFHYDLLPSLQICVRKALPDVSRSERIYLTHWGVFNNREMRSGMALSSHAYAAALDLHAITYGDKVLNFEKAKDAITDLFETFLNREMPTAESPIDEATYQNLFERFMGSPEYQASEMNQFWTSLFDCLHEYRFSSNAGSLPTLVENPDGSGTYLRKVLRLKGESKTVAHDNHVHID